MKNRKNPYSPKTVAFWLMGGGAALALGTWYLSKKDSEEEEIRGLPVQDQDYYSTNPDDYVKPSDQILPTPPVDMPVLDHQKMLETHLSELESDNEQIPFFSEFPVDENGVVDKTKYQPIQVNRDADRTPKERDFYAKIFGLTMSDFMKRRKIREKKKEKNLDLARRGDYELIARFDPEYVPASLKKSSPAIGDRASLNPEDVKDPAIRPDFKETLKFVDYKKLLAGTPEKRRENMTKIAEVSGISFAKEDVTDSVEMQKKAVPIFREGTANSDRKYVDTYLKNCKEKGIVYALAALLACEGSDNNLVGDTYFKQLEYVAMLWAIINRFYTGITAKKLKGSFKKNYALVDGIALALGYDPIERIKANKGSKKDLAIRLIPLVRAFLAGYFSDITGGATHWYHPPKKYEFPPLYYYPAGTKKRDGVDIAAYSLRKAGVPVSFVNDCIFVKVDENN